MREMKDSGIPWIGKIPSSWEIMCGKYLFSNAKEIVGTKVNDYERLALTLHGVIKRSKNDTEGLQPEDFNTYQILRKNELVFKLIDLQNISTSRVGLSPYDGIVSPAYIVLKTKENVIPSFAEKYYLMMWMNQIFNALGDAGVRSSLNVYELLEIKVPVPSIFEQNRISDYLDSKCARIDSIRENVEAEIEALKRYKKSVITEAVTKGLDKNVKMKDSGIPWIGEIPKDWKISRLKYILKEPMKYGANESGVAYSDALPRYIRITDIDSEGKLRKDGKLSLNEDIAKGYILKNKSILFARSGGTVGKTFFYRKEYGTAAFAGYLISAVIDENKALPEWIYYYVNSSAYWEWVNQIYTQSTIQNIGADKYSEMSIPICPNISLQKNILKLLDTRCSQIDSIIQKKQELLANLDTYKKSLIYEYVTGKKEVPAV